MGCLLVIEEDNNQREMLVQALKKKGFNVAQTEDQKDALRAVNSSMPVSVVLAGPACRDQADFMLRIRKARPGMPIIFLRDYFFVHLKQPLNSCAHIMQPNGYPGPKRFQVIERLIRIASDLHRFSPQARPEAT